MKVKAYENKFVMARLLKAAQDVVNKSPMENIGTWCYYSVDTDHYHALEAVVKEIEKSLEPESPGEPHTMETCLDCQAKAKGSVKGLRVRHANGAEGIVKWRDYDGTLLVELDETGGNVWWARDRVQVIPPPTEDHPIE